MSTDPQFLSFKGLKQYTPEDGWGQVNAILQSHTAPAPQAQAAQPQAMPHVAVPENVPTLTEEPGGPQSQDSQMFDPLISELFEQLRVPPSDALQRELQERLQKLDQEMHDLRSTITQHLSDVQRAADQQLTSARLRAEVSALAQTKLSAKLNPRY